MVTRVGAPLLPLVDRGDLARPDRRPLGAPDRLAGRDDLPGGRRARGGDGPRPRDLLGRRRSLRKASGLRVRLPLQDLTVVAADAPTLEPFAASSPTSSTCATVTAGRPRVGQRGRLRHLAEAHRQRPGRRPAPGQERPAGHQGHQVRRLVGRRRRRRHRRRARPVEGSTPWRPSWRRRPTARPAAPRRCCPAAASSCSTRGHPRAGGRGPGPRRGPRRPAGPPRRRPGCQRPDQPDRARATSRSGRPPWPTSR